MPSGSNEGTTDCKSRGRHWGKQSCTAHQPRCGPKVESLFLSKFNADAMFLLCSGAVQVHSYPRLPAQQSPCSLGVVKPQAMWLPRECQEVEKFCTARQFPAAVGSQRAL